jgi:hypothetical protein
LLGEDAEIAARLDPAALDRLFDLRHALRWADDLIAEASAI